MSPEPATIRDRLSHLLPAGSRLEGFCPPEAAERLQEHWSRLEGLGFELEVRQSSIRVRHRDRGFDSVIELSASDDLGERRRVFAELKATFGGLRDRLPWLFQASPAVTVPFESLRAITEVCQQVREKVRQTG